LSERFRRQVALVIEALPFVATETDFALKGGTAINLFVRDMPRLSVDIDLTYLPVAPRPQSLAAIDSAMKRIAAAMRNGLGCQSALNWAPLSASKRDLGPSTPQERRAPNETVAAIGELQTRQNVMGKALKGIDLLSADTPIDAAECRRL